MTPSSPPQAQTSLFEDEATEDGYDISDALNAEAIDEAEREQSFSRSVSRVVDYDTKAEAMKRATDNANPLWITAAIDVLRDICKTKATFTSDDVLIALESSEVRTKDTRALGSILTQAARLRWCRKTGTYVPSKRKACHSRPILVWESLIHSASV